MAVENSLAVPKTELPNDPAFPLPGIKPRELSNVHRRLCMQMFTAALFMMPKVKTTQRVDKLTNVETKSGISIQWNSIYT